MLPLPLFAAALFSAKTLGILLWIGLAVLSIALVVLMRTRWGQTEPIWKCVGLSVFAHVLFGGYAYGTKLVFEAPPQADRVVKLSAFDTDDGDSESGHSRHSESGRGETRPWEKLASDAEQHLAADVSRPRIAELPQEPELPAETPAPRAILSPADLALAAEPQRPTPERPRAQSPRPTAAAPSVATIETPAPERRIETEPIGPSAARLQRVEPSPVDDVATSEPARKIPTELLDVNTRKPGAAELVAGAESAKAASDGSNNSAGTPAIAASSSRATGSHYDPPSGTGAPTKVGPVARRLGDGDQLPSLYQFRVAPDRLGAARLHGGNARTESAVEAALKWLAANQSADGRWDASDFGAGRETRTLGHDRGGAGAQADTGVTGLALLAFLAAGHTHLEGKYRQHVQHGLEFLVASQRADGNLSGKAELFASMYCHGMASLALSEAYAMTGDQRLRPYVERAIGYTVAAQHGTSGGWRYQPAEQGDMSQFGWQVMALKSAELAGIEIPERTRSGMARFLRSVSSGKNRGLASYRAGEGATRTMTAEALACRIFLNVDREAATVAEAGDFVIQELPQDGKPNLYYWYYGTLSLYQLQDSRWERWNAALQDQLLKRQRTDGELAGSFDTDDLWGGYGGRVYTTAIATLSLEVYYRYLPLYERSAAWGR